MFPYFVLTGFVAFMAVTSSQRRYHSLVWLGAFVIMLLFVGLRHHVGMDWNNYLYMIVDVSKGSFVESMEFSEPGYALLIWSSGKMGWGVYGSNVLGTLIFLLGLFRYAKTTPHPWVALVVAMPILVIVVSMSANRQAVAIGVLLWVVAVWDQTAIHKRVIAITLAAMFHASAFVFLGFVMADLKVRRGIKIVFTSLFFFLVFAGLQWSGYFDYYDQLYLSGQNDLTKSEGAILHVLFNAGPAAVYFFLSKNKRKRLLPNQLHQNMALLAIALIPATFLASSASGRISLYLFPVSMYIFSAYPLTEHINRNQQLLRLAIALLMLGLLYLWLGYANSSHAHIPYENLMTIPPHRWRLCC